MLKQQAEAPEQQAEALFVSAKVNITRLQQARVRFFDVMETAAELTRSAAQSRAESQQLVKQARYTRKRVGSIPGAWEETSFY